MNKPTGASWANIDAVQLTAELYAYAEVVAYLPPQALHALRHRLKRPDNVALGLARPAVGALRVMLLDRVAHQLATQHGVPEGYLLDVGDLLPSAPDDLAGLEVPAH